MAKDYNQVLLDKGYSQEQIDAMVGAVNSGQNANDVVQNYTPTTPSSSSSSSSNSGGNYVYNPVTEYYELQNDGSTQRTTSSSGGPADGYTNATARNMATGGSEFGRNNQTSNTTQQTTPVKPQETTGSTASNIQQQGAMKPLSQEYYNQTSDNALNTIRNNLNNYRQTNPEYFTDYDTFKRNFSYDSRNDEQKNLLDTWYNGYQSQLQLSSVPTTDLYTQYKDGQISTTELEGLRISNPEKYAELQAQINKGNIIAAYDDEKGVDTTGLSLQDMAYNMAMQTFTKFMNGETSSEASNIFREYEEKMESPEMLSLSDQTTEVQEQIENIQSDLDAIKKSVEAEYAGTGASRSKINAIIADRSYDLQLQLRTLNSEYNKYATQYNNRMQQYQNEFSMQLQEYQINQQERNQQMQELGFALDLMNFETNDQKAQREWDYWVKQQEYQNGNINSKDYQTRYKAALTSVQNLLSQYPGIPMQRSAEQMAQDVLKAIDSGSDLGAELTKINKQIQQKPEYKYMYNQTFRPATSQGFGSSVSIGGTDYIEYNGKLYTADEFNRTFGGAAGPTQTTNGGVQYDPVSSQQEFLTLADFMDSKKTGSKGGQCGKFVNDYLQSLGIGRLYGNSVASKTNTINVNPTDINNLSVGSVAVFDYSNVKSVSDNARKYGHVGIVTEIDYQRGRVKLLESNLKGDEKVSTRRVDINSPVLKGYFDPSKGSVVGLDGGMSTLNTNVTSVGGLNDNQITSLAKEYINGDKSYSDIAKTYGDNVLNAVGLRASQLQEGGYTKSTILTDPTKIANMESKLRSEYEKSVSDFRETEDWVNKMKEAYNKIDSDKNAASQAIVIAYNKILDPSSVVREGEYARTAEGQSVLGQIQSKLEQMAKGGAGLTKKQLKSLVDVADSFSQNSKQKQLDKAKQIKVSIDKYGLTPEAVLDINILNQLNGNTSYGYTMPGTGFNIQNTNFYQQWANTAGGVGSTIPLTIGGTTYTVNR